MMRSLVLAAAVAAGSATQDLEAPALNGDLIAKINADPASTWTAGVNSKFEGMTIGQAKRLMGTLRQSPLWAEKKATLPIKHVEPLGALPTEFNSTANWPACATVIGHIRDQSDCGSCWAHGSTEAINDRFCIVHNITLELSAQDTASCCNGNHGCGGSQGCDGGFPQDAFNYFVKEGVVTGGDNPTVGKGTTCFPYQLEMCDHHEGGPYPQCPNVCSGGECSTPACPADENKGCSEAGYTTPWAKDKHFSKTAYGVNGVTQIMTDIYNNGPVSASFDVYEDFLTYKTGVYVHKTGALLGGHTVRIYGWGTDAGTDYWLVANSWNNFWGDNGSFKIIRGKDECGIEDDIAVGSV